MDVELTIIFKQCYAINGILNFLFSILTLWIILKMRLKQDKFVLLVTLMTVFQGLFDISFFIQFVCTAVDSSQKNLCYSTFWFSTWFGELPSVGFSLVIIGIMTIFITTLKVVNVELRNILPISALVVIPSFALGIRAAVIRYNQPLSKLNDFAVSVSHLRTALIAANVLCCFIIVCLIRYRNRQPYFKLVSRLGVKLCLYPFFQIVSKLSNILFFSLYGQGVIQYHGGSSRLQAGLFVLSVISLPSGGFLNFLIFIFVQNGVTDFLCPRIELLKPPPSNFVSDNSIFTDCVVTTSPLSSPVSIAFEPTFSRTSPLLLHEMDENQLMAAVVAMATAQNEIELTSSPATLGTVTEVGEDDD